MSEAEEDALLQAAVTRRDAGDLAAAEACYRQLLATGRRHAGALHDLGVICLLTARREEAEAAFRAALQIDSRRADTHNALGAALREAGEFASAITHHHEAIRLQPAFAEAHNNLGLAQMARGESTRALASFRRAAALKPALAAAWLNLGRAYQSRHEAAAAIEPLERACALAPRDAACAASLGTALGTLKRFPQAIAALEHAVRLAPGDAAARLDLLHVKLHVCDWTGFMTEAAAIRKAVAAGEGRPVSPFFFMGLPGASAREQRRCAERWAALYALPDGKAPPARPPAAGNRRLRIGYLGSDFHAHAGMRLMAGVFEHHDRSRFEIFAFSLGADTGDAVRARVERAFEDFVDLRAFTDAAAAAEIRARGIDVLVLRDPYTDNGRPGILAHRAAPVQVSYLGYPGTTGAPFVDFLIADRFIVPEGAADGYTERLVYLPDTYQCNDDTRPAAAPPARAACGLPEDAFVFCCFNQTYKITPEVFDAWCRLLGAVPCAVLWLWASNPWAEVRLRAEAKTRGIDPARLVFAPTVAWEAHVARIAAADLFIDTFPFTAHTTASDALWAGVPVVTRAGETFASRVAGSVLSAAGLPGLITQSIADYEALALKLARDPDALSALRERLRNVAKTPLFDTARFTRKLETAYEAMWRENAEGAS